MCRRRALSAHSRSPDQSAARAPAARDLPPSTLSARSRRDLGAISSAMCVRVCVRFDVAVFYVNAKTRNFREVRDKLECVTGGNITRLVYTTRLRARDGTGCVRRRTRTTAPRPILADVAQTDRDRHTHTRAAHAPRRQ